MLHQNQTRLMSFVYSQTPSRAYMLRRTQEQGAEVLAEVSAVLGWAERTDIISTDQKNTYVQMLSIGVFLVIQILLISRCRLLLEFSRRLDRLDEEKRKSDDLDVDTSNPIFMEGLGSFLSL